MGEVTAWPPDGGETGELIRARDWAATPLGPLDWWPPSLRTAVDIMLGSPVPASVIWGPGRIHLYNDGYAAIAGDRHPALFGRPAAEGWGDARAVLEPLLDAAFAGGPAVVEEDRALPLGGTGTGAEPRRFTFTFSPVHDDAGAVAGAFHIVVETTHRRLAETALRQSEERHRVIVESARDYAILTTDSEGRIESWSPGAREVYGWEPEEVIGRNFAVLFVPEDREASVPERELETARRTGAAPDVRWHLRADGSRVFVDGTTRLMRRPDGSPAGFLKIGQDATGARRVEDALRDSEERYRMIVEGARDYAILTTDPGGLITSWSPGAEAVYGWRAGDIVGQPVAMTFTPEDRAAGAPEAELATAAANGWAPDVRWHLRSDGTRVFIDGFTRPLHHADGSPRGFLKIGQDVTEHRRMEEALGESEARFRAVADLVPDLLWSNDAAGVTTWYNRRWMEYTGQTEAEAIDYGWADALHPDDREGSLRTFQAAVDAGWPLRQEHRIRRADGVYRWFLVQSRPVRDESGRATRWFGAATDIHELRLAMQALRGLNQTLEERVAERTAELAAANQGLTVEVRQRAQAEAARRELLRQLVTAEEDERRRISRELHDQMGQQVTGLLLGLKALERGGAPPGQIEALQRLADAIARDLQHLALELRPPALDSLGLAPALHDHLAEWSRRHGIACDFHAPEVMGERLPPEIEATVYRVVQEGLTNVLKHAGATRVGLVLERRRGVLSAILEDDGGGFDPGLLAHPHKARRLGIRGMRERVALLGGTLQIESAPGNGTTLFVRIPEAPGLADAEPSASLDGGVGRGAVDGVRGEEGREAGG
ncbi:MAG TPA: PAS domain S-box protein [Longimicrobium sp.]|nr:PAS domain S-box protein [Longimicrobium sp.]